MKDIFDISQFVNVKTRQLVLNNLVERVKTRRKDLKISRKELSEKSMVSYASIRRFEETGEISLSSLLKISEALNAIADFDTLYSQRMIKDLKDFKG